MKRLLERHVWSRVLLSATVALMALQPIAAQNPPADLTNWTTGLWSAARKGDKHSMEMYLSNVPESWSESYPTIYEVARQYQSNREAAVLKREEARAQAMSELHEHLEKGELLHALRLAVTVQTLSDTLESAFDHPDIRRVIDLARVEIPRATSVADWLVAQEMLYRLRTLYDDTDRRAEYNAHDRSLKEINRRVMLLAEYAPRQVHELRTSLNERLGEKPPAFREAGREGWQERRQGIDGTMLRRALSLTSSEHIEARAGSTWRPLLAGGLDAMRLIATTPGLESTFAGLQNEQAAREWLTYIDTQREYLSKTPDASLNQRYMLELLSGLEAANQRTLNLPAEVVYHEFGNGSMYELGVAKEDEYTAVIWPNEIRRFRQSTDGKFVGVGIMIGYNDMQEIMVVNPLEGTPAFRAGVRSNDVIETVNNEPTTGWTLNDAVDKITGPRGTEVVLRLRRTIDAQPQVLEFEIRRDVIELHSVKGWHKESLNAKGDPNWNWLIDETNRIGYVRVTGFNEDTYRDLQQAWTEMNKGGPLNGLIVDLRHNPGGLLDAAVNVSNLFIPGGPVVSIEGKAERDREVLSARPNRSPISDAKVPTVVLVNKGSASASEIVAGALQAHGAAIVVGKRTWGKGSVQRVYGVTQTAQIKITTQYYRLPPRPGETQGRLVHRLPNTSSWGVEPDIDVDMTPEQIMASIDLRDAADVIENLRPAAGEALEQPQRPHPSELITNGLDPQLETALLILQARAIGEQVAAGHARR